ncbi:tetraspanin family protein [Streptomyces griseoruber]|uniref:Uncharacterized protein n=1 Tax=Streptomyces griseoruber TaxID=1943 RepID=A0A101SVU7_9ACTN|nr:tetraspanin family protein [Streptomyces griseoruber]KUN80858.1 hypothetical protein AQJ64_25120 [Streptomyces griseoruber]
MPLAVEIVLIVIGVLLLAAALIGSGISRRLMTIPKMKRAPRIVIAILGVLLLVGGMWGVTTEEKHHGPTLAALKEHLPPDVKSRLDCTEASETPKDAVELDCSTPGSVPDQVWYYMFDDVDAMQNWWWNQTDPAHQPGGECTTIADFKQGSSLSYSTEDRSVTTGDIACFMDGNTVVDVYTDRRFNIVVWSQTDSQNFSEFMNWIVNTSLPVGDDGATPATPSHTDYGQ